MPTMTTNNSTAATQMFDMAARSDRPAPQMPSASDNIEYPRAASWSSSTVAEILRDPVILLFHLKFNIQTISAWQTSFSVFLIRVSGRRKSIVCGRAGQIEEGKSPSKGQRWNRRIAREIWKLHQSEQRRHGGQFLAQYCCGNN